MSPSTVPRNGTVTVTGEVTNRSESSWTDLNVYLLTSSEPITSEEELEAAAQSPAEEEVGGRITTPGLYQDIDDLEPGESTGYRLSVPASQLSIGSEPGVYWLGVHVLGA
ncbi:MAG TPA: hypothetical protein VLA97_05235, partial [Nocardioidaceae bacterium]|nr:hypothetical protein [Nocardioidaceae bacterium]